MIFLVANDLTKMQIDASVAEADVGVFDVPGCFELPLAWLLADHAGLGTTGAFIACFAAFSLFAVASGAVFRRGHWKTVAV